MDSIYEDPAPALEPPFVPTVGAMIRWARERYGNRDAQVRGRRRLTYAELDEQSSRLAKGLLAMGLGKGSRIGLLMPNGPDFTVAFMAAARIGAIVSPLSTLSKARELRWLIRYGDFQAFLTSAQYLTNDYLTRLEEAFPALTEQQSDRLALTDAPYLRSVFVWGECDRNWARSGLRLFDEVPGDRPELDDLLLEEVEKSVTPSDHLCIIFTSGSSADPKGVVHTHASVLRHSWQKAERYWTVGLDGERLVGARPHFWVAGLASTLFQALLKGICLLDPDEIDGLGVLDLIETKGATAACGNLPWLKSLASDPDLKAAGYETLITALECAVFARHTKDGLRYLNDIRAERSPIVVEQPIDRLPRSYGMTETLAAHTSIPAGTLLPPSEIGSCGLPMPGVRLKIADPATGKAVPRGEIGEVYVAGYCLMDGLYKREHGSTFNRDGYYQTGDLALMHADGFVHFHSRTGEMLKIKGANVAPAEVESCLMAMPDIVRAAVVGLTSKDSDVMLVAAVEMKQGTKFDEAAIRNSLRKELSSFKVPARILALPSDAFPLTASGKIRKPPLTEALAELL